MRPLKALISKSTLNRAHVHKAEADLYLVDPYNAYYNYLHEHYPSLEITPLHLFIVDKSIIIKVLKDVGEYARINSLLGTYSLEGFSREMLNELKADIHKKGFQTGEVKRKYGLVKIDVNLIYDRT